MASGELASIDSALDAIRKDVYRLSEAPMVPSSWRRLGVDVLFTNFFSEQAQLLLEARGLRGDSSLPFLSTRARQFRRRAHRLFGVGQSDFKDCQRRMTDVLGSFMQAQLGALNTDEDLALGLWLLDHERGNLHLVAASDRSHADEATLLPVPLDLSSKWASVEAVTQGVTQTRVLNSYASRWRQVRAIPIRIAEPGGTSLPVGAATLASNAEPGTSILNGAGDRVLNQLENAICEFIEKLLARA